MKTAIIGAFGAVGEELQALLFDRDPQLLGPNSTASYRGVDVAFFCVSQEVAREEIPKARREGALCIDASTAFRLHPDIPLVIPEINGHLLARANEIIASPNCTTTLMLLPLFPIHVAFGIKRIVTTTYQALSGAGYRGIDELDSQLRGEPPSDLFPKPCAHNVFLHESSTQPSGYVEEEEKMQSETRKIFEDRSIGVSARCIRVPVYRAHCIAVNVELHREFTLYEVRSLLEKAPGVIYRDGVSALDATCQKSVFCGNLRRDNTQRNTLELWVCGDQLLKGSALNMFQMAIALCSI